LKVIGALMASTGRPSSMDTSDSNDWPEEDSTNEPPLTEPEEAEPSSSAEQKEPAADESSESHDEKATPTSSIEEDGPVDVTRTGPLDVAHPSRSDPLASRRKRR